MFKYCSNTRNQPSMPTWDRICRYTLQSPFLMSLRWFGSGWSLGPSKCGGCEKIQEHTLCKWCQEPSLIPNPEPKHSGPKGSCQSIWCHSCPASPRLEGAPGAHPVPKAGTARAGCSGLFPVGFGITLVSGDTNALGNPFQCLVTLTVK